VNLFAWIDSNKQVLATTRPFHVSRFEKAPD
jgi:hypothetical protein